MFRIFLLLHALSSLTAHADELVLGHNLTPTTNMLGAQNVLFGTYAVAYGINDHLSVGTSPWLDISYRMPNLGLKYSLPYESTWNNLAFEALYFKTYPSADKLFEQESYFLRMTFGMFPADFWSVYLSSGYQYFFNDKRAYSLRAVPQTDDPRTLSVSSLQVFKASEAVSFLLELGLLGLNYPTRFLHYGGSLNVQINKFMLQVGFSVSRSQKAIEYQVDKNERMYWSGTSEDRTRFGNVAIIHPEFQIEYLFD